MDNELKELLLEYADSVHMVAGIMKNSGVQKQDNIELTCEEVKIIKQSFALATDRVEKAYSLYLEHYADHTDEENDIWKKATKDVTATLSGVEFYFLKVGQNNPMVCEMTLINNGYIEDYKLLYSLVNELEEIAKEL